MGLISKFKQYFDLEEDSYARQEEVHAYEKPALRKKKVVSLQSVQHTQNARSDQQAQKQSKVMLKELRSYDEVQGIADELRSHRAVVINLQLISRYQAIRIIDFLSGSVYALGGDIQKLGPHTFICTPDNIDVSGVISEFGDEAKRR
ncbi:MAG TPA: cell division protein SepF [Bacillales bacterium]|nr:cell division protein SepF [Bacillales bacterium]